MAKPTMVEVKEVVFSMDKHSIAGPDGFNGVFFQHFWDVIVQDVYNVVCAFLDGFKFPQGMTSTVITLIPKCDGAMTWKQFRPISLCTFTNKIVTKLISTRLSAVLPKVILDFQTGFVRGRLIQDNILLAQELVKRINKGKHGGNVLLNVDMTKTFDMLSWDFLKLILQKFGFSEGVRQGDPLSPAPFILADEYLLRGLAKLYKDNPAMSYNSSRHVQVPCLAFANDWLIFCNGFKFSLDKLMAFLDHYQFVSGQIINKDKSTCIFSSKVSPARLS
ncbi:hypothetical protein LIER_42980 [Lithospermum erythrorhizon]|uniref:Reverse transcriptase domain-containing protein n=1 Tax=Lithospermum erythrorhizon TaxID=34254 RepID=A0AAV3PCP4_LITER